MMSVNSRSVLPVENKVLLVFDKQLLKGLPIILKIACRCFNSDHAGGTEDIKASAEGHIQYHHQGKTSHGSHGDHIDIFFILL